MIWITWPQPMAWRLINTLIYMNTLLKKINFPEPKSSILCFFGFHKYVDIKVSYGPRDLGVIVVTYQVCARCRDCPTLER